MKSDRSFLKMNRSVDRVIETMESYQEHHNPMDIPIGHEVEEGGPGSGPQGGRKPKAKKGKSSTGKTVPDSQKSGGKKIASDEFYDDPLDTSKDVPGDLSAGSDSMGEDPNSHQSMANAALDASDSGDPQVVANTVIDTGYVKFGGDPTLKTADGAPISLADDIENQGYAFQDLAENGELYGMTGQDAIDNQVAADGLYLAAKMIRMMG